jgi:hypothetical protein
MFTVSLATGIGLAAALKTQLDAGFLYLFAGTVPTTAEGALDMVSTHTQIVKISLTGGATGLTFATPTAAVLSKTVAEVWRGTSAFSGANQANPTLTAAFFRFTTAADDGRGAANPATGYRLQGTVSGPGGAGDLVIGNAVIAPAFLQNIDNFRVILDRG